MSIGLLLWTALIDVSCAVPSRYFVNVMGGSVVINVCVHVRRFPCCQCHRSIVLIVLIGVPQDIIVLPQVCIRVHVPCSIIVRLTGPNNQCLAIRAISRGPAPHRALTLFRL
jgi:hypothetical protein